MVDYQKQWNFLKNKLEAGNLAHAYIFSGSDIANIKQFAEELISLVCNAKLNIQQYPDVLMVGSKNSSSSIKNEYRSPALFFKIIRRTKRQDVDYFIMRQAGYGITNDFFALPNDNIFHKKP